MTMAGAPDGAHVLSRFQDVLKESTFQCFGNKSYVSPSRLKNWWETDTTPGTSRRKRHVDIMLYYVYRNIEQPVFPIQSEQICSENDCCLIVFSILLKVGGIKAGACIAQYENNSIFDRNLPCPLSTLISRKLPYAEAFDKAQWAFAPTRFSLDATKIYTKDYVVPICKHEPINPGKGGTANLWQIGVQEEFVDPKLREKVKTCRFHDGDLGWCYQFALKKYGEGYARLFENEKKAFGALRGKEGMIQYLGNYEHKEVNVLSDGSLRTTVTYNLILEYAELDLDIYFQDTRPPILEGELAHFWEDMFDVAGAVNSIHHIKVDRGGVEQEYFGWHADIKPDNILIVQGKFKLSDPGFARFERKSDKDLATIAGGTETYSAPECYRAAQNSRGTAAQVQRTIDVWSLGCVFSIAATWVVLGYDGIRQFRTFRDSAVQKIMNEQRKLSSVSTDTIKLTRGDYFHNGHDVLSDIHDWHAFLRRFLRQGDTITGRILDLVGESMLKGNPNDRMQARDLCVHLKRLLVNFREEKTRRQPLLGSIMQALLQVDEEVPQKPEASNALLTPVIVDGKNIAPKQLDIPKRTTHRSEFLRSELSAQGMPLRPDREAEDDEPHPNRQPTGDYFSYQGQQRYYPGAGYSDRDPHHSQNLAGGVVISRQPTGTTLATSRTGLQSLVQSSGRKSQNVFQAREEIAQRRSPWLRKLGKDDFLTRFFDNRDIIFLVDNAESMEDDWAEATFLLETLAMKLEGQDENGMDLYFTMGKSFLKDCKKPAKFRDKMNEKGAKPIKGIHTDLSPPLAKILNKYLNDLKMAMRVKVPIERIKKLTLIVLTDGRWEGMGDREDIGRLIAEFERQMQHTTKDKLSGLKDRLAKRRVSIEFVRLGNDADAIARLRHLDNDLPYMGAEDIVDTEPSNGDLNKMILGSFVEEFDKRDEVLTSPELPQSNQHYTTTTQPSQRASTARTDAEPWSPGPDGIPRIEMATTMRESPASQPESTQTSRIRDSVPQIQFNQF